MAYGTTVSKITDSSLTYTYSTRSSWNGKIPDDVRTVKVRWRPDTLTGMLKTAAARTIAKKLGWNSPRVYNDMTGFRKSDKTISRRIKWENCIRHPLTRTEIAMFTDEVKALMNVTGLDVHISNARKSPFTDGTYWTGTIYIHMRESVC